MRRVGKTVASLACACCAAQCVPGAVDPGSISLDGGVLANPLLQDTFTQDRPSRPGTPGPQDPVGVLKRLGGSKPPGVRISHPVRGRSHNHFLPQVILGRWWFVGSIFTLWIPFYRLSAESGVELECSAAARWCPRGGAYDGACSASGQGPARGSCNQSPSGRYC